MNQRDAVKKAIAAVTVEQARAWRGSNEKWSYCLDEILTDIGNGTTQFAEQSVARLERRFAKLLEEAGEDMQ